MKNKPGKWILSDFKNYYKALIIETTWYWHKDRQIDGPNKIENPEIGLYIYRQLIFTEEQKQCTGERITFSKNVAETAGYS